MSLPIPAFSRVASQSRAVNVTLRMPRDVCPHCKRVLTAHAFATGEYINRTYHYRQHGDVAPMRSAVWVEQHESE